MQSPLPTEGAGGVMVIYAIWFVLLALVHIMLAVGVNRDAQHTLEKGGYTYFVSPAIWSLAVLVTGVLGVGVYWVMHHSTLRRD